MARPFLSALASFIVVVGAIPAMIFLIPNAESKLLDAYDLVGEDKTGDAKNFIGPSADVSGTISATRTDVLSLEMAPEDETLQFKLNIAALPAGTGSYMYAVHFKVANKPYLTCWTIAWVGGQTTAAENTLGCSRFAGETTVGPVTTAAGVHVGSAQQKNFIRWEVPLSAIGNPGPDAILTDIFADTWFRGANPSGPGCPSSSQSACTWNQADRAPDTGAWTYSLAPPAPALNLTLLAEPANQTVGSGQTATFAITVSLVGDGSANLTLNTSGLSENWTAEFSSPSVALSTESNSTNLSVSIAVPATATNGTSLVTIMASDPSGLNATTSVSITVDTSIFDPASTAPTQTASTDGTAGTPKEDEGGSAVPSTNLLGLMAAMAAATLFTAARRRRD